MKVWAVSEGTWDDYQIRFVFASRDLAHELADADDCLYVEEFEVSEELPEFWHIWTRWRRTDIKSAGEEKRTTLTKPPLKSDPEIKDWGYGYSAASATRDGAIKAMRAHGRTRRNSS